MTYSNITYQFSPVTYVKESVEQPTISILTARTLISKFCCKFHLTKRLVNISHLCKITKLSNVKYLNGTKRDNLSKKKCEL